MFFKIYCLLISLFNFSLFVFPILFFTQLNSSLVDQSENFHCEKIILCENITLYKTNKVITLNIHGTINTTANSWNILTHMPEEYLPDADTFGIIWDNGNACPRAFSIWSGSREVGVYTDKTSITLRGSITYMLI